MSERLRIGPAVEREAIADILSGRVGFGRADCLAAADAVLEAVTVEVDEFSIGDATGQGYISDDNAPAAEVLPWGPWLTGWVEGARAAGLKVEKVKEEPCES